MHTVLAWSKTCVLMLTHIAVQQSSGDPKIAETVNFVEHVVILPYIHLILTSKMDTDSLFSLSIVTFMLACFSFSVSKRQFLARDY